MYLYVRHLLRKALSSQITPLLLKLLQCNPNRMHVIVDYKQKILPTGHREVQTEAFGKKGKSLHGATCIRWSPTSRDFEVLNVRVVCDDSNQTWFHTIGALRVTLEKVVDAWPTVGDATLQSDGGSNYVCTALMHMLKDVFSVLGVRLLRHVISEVGGGKNLVDQSFQGAQQTMDQARAGGMDTRDAQKFVDALDTSDGAGIINVGMVLDRSSEPKKGPSPLKGIDSLYDREYCYDTQGNFIGLRVRQFFGVGLGNFVPAQALNNLWSSVFRACEIMCTS